MAEPSGMDKGIKKAPDGTPGFRMGKHYLLAIGINEYRHLPILYNCVKDVQDLVNLLTREYQFAKEDVSTLFDQEATKENITSAFYRLATTVTPDDNVVIYFSGHGALDRVLNRGHWIPVEAEEGKIHQYLPNSEVRDFLNGIKSRHTFLVADSCFSGSLFASRSAGKSNIRRYEKDPSRWGLSSGRNEIVSDGKPGYNSPFAESLLYQLRENPDDLSVDELCFRVREYVEANSNQVPIGEPLKVEGHKNGVFVFHRKGSIPKSPTHAIPPTLQQGEPANTGQPRTKGINWKPYAILIAAILTTVIILWQQPWGIKTSTPPKPTDEAAFKMASDTGTVAALRGFMEKFPKSVLKPDAQRRLDELEKQNQVFLNEAETFLKAGKPAEARRLLEKARRINPDDPRIRDITDKLEKGIKPAPSTITKVNTNTDPVASNMVLVKGGTFTMGCKDGRDSDCNPNERDSRGVTIPTFFIGRYEVTQAQWRALMGSNSNPSLNKGCNNCPVENVSWDDAQKFIHKLNLRTGKRYRLPTEAEWEYAARGGNQSRDFLYSGSNNLIEVAWYDANAKEGNTNGAEKTTRPVGQKKPNELGLYDMSGNVREWCEDYWHGKYNSNAPSNGKAWVDSPTDSSRVHRGGGWSHPRKYCRASYRNSDPPNYSSYGIIGFRLARSLQ